jgi:hypothetical protein
LDGRANKNGWLKEIISSWPIDMILSSNSRRGFMELHTRSLCTYYTSICLSPQNSFKRIKPEPNRTGGVPYIYAGGKENPYSRECVRSYNDMLMFLLSVVLSVFFSKRALITKVDNTQQCKHED